MGCARMPQETDILTFMQLALQLAKPRSRAEANVVEKDSAGRIPVEILKYPGEASVLEHVPSP